MKDYDRRTPGQLRAALALADEARVNLEARVARMEPMWAAGHAYCAAYESDGDYRLILHAALLAAHRATTPSPDQPQYVVIAVDELEELRSELALAHHEIGSLTRLLENARTAVDGAW